MNPFRDFINSTAPDFLGSAGLIVALVMLSILFYAPKGQSPRVGISAYLAPSKPVFHFWSSAGVGAVAVYALFYFTYTVTAGIYAVVDDHWNDMSQEMCKTVSGCTDYSTDFAYDPSLRTYVTTITLTMSKDAQELSEAQKVYEAQVSELEWAQRIFLAETASIKTVKAAPKKARK